jgi:hypothetical protein
MTPEQKRIAIAEALGYTHVRIIKAIEGPPDIGIGHHPTKPHSVPDYLNDLNAMHEAEKVLTEEQRIDFIDWLGVCGDFYTEAWSMTHATAAEHAEAFGRSLKLW